MENIQVVIQGETFKAYVIRGYLSAERADGLLQTGLNLPHWIRHKIRVFGRECHQPRLTISMHDDCVEEYKYSQAIHPVTPWDEGMRAIADELAGELGAPYNACLLNYYRDGHDYIGDHSDDTRRFTNTTIAGISLGATRRMVLKHKTSKVKTDFELRHGDLFVMEGDFQRYYTHGMPKQAHVSEPRISLTFRAFHQAK